MWEKSCLILLVLCTPCWGQWLQDDSNNITFTRDLLDFFNLRRTFELWSDILEENVIKSENCSQDFEEYFHGLQRKEIWALKSEYTYLERSFTVQGSASRRNECSATTKCLRNWFVSINITNKAKEDPVGPQSTHFWSSVFTPHARHRYGHVSPGQFNPSR